MSTPHTALEPMGTHHLLGVLLSSGTAEVRALDTRGAGLVATLAVGRETYRLQLDPLSAYGAEVAKPSEQLAA